MSKRYRGKKLADAKRRFLVNLAALVIKVRNKNNLSQKKLGSLLGKNDKWIRDVEYARRRDLTLEDIVEIFLVLNDKLIPDTDSAMQEKEILAFKRGLKSGADIVESIVENNLRDIKYVIENTDKYDARR